MADRVNFIYLADQFKNIKNVKSVLEVGCRDVNGSSKNFIKERKLSYFGIDIDNGQEVDAVVDITQDLDSIKKKVPQKFDLIICFNVLEHVFEPIKALNNMLELLNDSGYLMIVVPIVWDLHEYPYDFYRLNPDFFKKFAENNKITILKDSFLLSTRDDCKFYKNIDELPQIIPQRFKRGIMKSFLKFIHRRFMPGVYDCWPHICLNVIYQKCKNG